MKIKNSNIIICLIVIPLIISAILLIANLNFLGFLLFLAVIVLGFLFYLILKDPFLGLSLTIATLPFERIPTLDIGLFTLKIDQIFAGMTIVAWILKLFFDRKKIQPYSIGWTILFFILVSFISVLYAVDFNRALTVFIFTIFMIIVSLVTDNLVTTKEKMQTVIKVFFYTAFFVCLFGLYQFAGDIIGLPITITGLKDIYSKAVLGFPRIQAFAMEPLFLANYLFIPLGLAVSLYLFRENKFLSNTKLLILIILILITLVLGISRGAYIALGVFVLFFIIFLARKVITVKNVVMLLISVSIIFGASYAFLKISNPNALDKFISHAKIEDFYIGESVQKRLADYQKAVDFWQTSPTIGIGPGNYGPKYKNYPSHDEVAGWEVVNNQYLETLAETGILGLIFLTVTFLIIFWRTVKAYFYTKDNFLRAVLIGLIAAFIAILVQYNFFSTLYIMHIWILIGLIIAAQNLCFSKKENETK